MRLHPVLRYQSLLVIAAAGLLAGPVMAIDRATEERLQGIERKLESRGLVDMLNRLDAMQRDLQQIRGDLELQMHRLDGIERRQREQYLDIDQRLQAVESMPAGAVASAPPDAAAPTGAAAGPAANAGAPVMVPSVTTQPGDPAAEKAEYDTALAVLRDGRYAEAAQAFKQFLTRYPGSSYAVNAKYWLGETYYVTRDFDQSLTTFKGLVQNHPDNPKMADSRLKIGYIHYENKNWKAARAELEAVVSTYPGSTAARLAGDRLARMKKEGR